jgi:hypothetical protein
MEKRLAGLATLCPPVGALYTQGSATFLLRPIPDMAVKVGDDRWTTARSGVPRCPPIENFRDAFLSCERE